MQCCHSLPFPPIAIPMLFSIQAYTQLKQCFPFSWNSHGIHETHGNSRYGLISRLSFLQCFDTVGLVIWPVKIVPEMTYLLCVEWDVKPYTLTHSRLNVSALRHKALDRSLHWKKLNCSDDKTKLFFVLSFQVSAPRLSADAIGIRQSLEAQSRYRRKYITAYDRHHFPAYLVC